MVVDSAHSIERAVFGSKFNDRHGLTAHRFLEQLSQDDSGEVLSEIGPMKTGKESVPSDGV